jgi:DNA processing protein
MSSTNKDRSEKLAWLVTLAGVEGVGPFRLYHLINHFGSPEKALSASIAKLTEIPGIGRDTASKIRENQDHKKSLRFIDEVLKHEWKFFLYDDPEYPEPLGNIPDRPPYLFYLGEFTEKDISAISIVGSRSASEDGRLFAENLSTALAENEVTVISGMARGVDIAAHRGALKANGRTIAVLGCSLDIIYPPEAKNLAHKITQSGALFSEFLPGTAPYGPNFPKRNRIISGLSQGVVVIEAAERSGALSTARHAIAQNREVFAVPGSPRSEMSRGTNRLIKEGAKLLTSVEDIFCELPRLKGQVRTGQVKRIEGLTDTEKKVLDSFAEGPVQIDNLSRTAGTPLPELMQILLALELKGIIKELSGKRYILN